MSEQEIGSNFRTIYRKLIYLQSEITALRGAISQLVKSQTGESIETIITKMDRFVKLEHDRLIEEIETENPALAAYVDFREELSNLEQYQWYFPNDDANSGDTKSD